MMKYILSILVLALSSGSNLVLGQEGNLNCSQYFSASSVQEICSVGAEGEGPAKSITARELTAEELDRIVGEGPGSFLALNDQQTSGLGGIILWDETIKQGSSTMSDSIALQGGSTVANGIQMNGIVK